MFRSYSTFKSILKFYTVKLLLKLRKINQDGKAFLHKDLDNILKCVFSRNPLFLIQRPPHIFPFQWYSLLPVYLSYLLRSHFPSGWRTSFKISGTTGLLMINSLILFIWKCLHCIFSLKDCFAACKYCSIAFWSPLFLMRSLLPVFVMCHFSLAVFGI